MKYNLDESSECLEAFNYLTKLVGKHAVVEIKKKSPARSLNQNNYIHLCLTYFADNFGYTLEEAKTLYKYVNEETYKYKKKGMPFYRSSADLSKDEMTYTIDKFRRFAAEHGCELPLAINQEWLRRIENDHEKLIENGI